VPALTLDNGETLTENVAVLQYIGDLNPSAKLAPPAGTMERYRLVEWLGFISSEVHKNFSPMFNKEAPEAAKEYALANLTKRLAYVQRALGSKTFVMGEQFTVADAYLYSAQLGPFVKPDLGRWPELALRGPYASRVTGARGRRARRPEIPLPERPVKAGGHRASAADS
jgi:glutathione S-transferase